MLKSFNLKTSSCIILAIIGILNVWAEQFNCLTDLDYSKNLELKSLQVQCDPLRPRLFKNVQCNLQTCFCVNKLTGKVFSHTEHLISSRYECLNRLVKLEIGIPNDQMIEQIATSFVPETPNSPAPTNIMAKVIERSVIGLLKEKASYSQYFIEEVNRKDTPSKDAMFSYYTVTLYLLGTETQVDASFNALQQELDKGRIGSLQIKRTISDLRILDNDQSIKSYDKDANERKLKYTEVNGNQIKSELAQSDVPSDTKGRFAINGNISPNDIQNQNINYKSSMRGWIKDKIDIIISQPGMLAGAIGAVLTVTLLLVLLLVFCIYRLRKRDEGSYTLDEAKKVQVNPAYTRAPTREFYA